MKIAKQCAIIACLLCLLLCGCGDREDGIIRDVTEATEEGIDRVQEMLPDSGDGHVRDTDGQITDGDTTASPVPEADGALGSDSGTQIPAGDNDLIGGTAH